jgi:uncharacterized protein (DUF58 family)
MSPEPRPQIDDLLELRHRANTIGLASHHRVNSLLQGLYQSVFRGQGMDFEEVREYREGDEIRNMDWRVTARTGTAHLKVFREERERAVMLAVDVGPHMSFGTRGTFKSVQAARATALLGWAAAGSQDRVGTLLYGNPVTGLRFHRPSRGRRALWRTLRALTEEDNREPHPGDPLVEALEKLNVSTPTGALIFIIGDLNRDPHQLELFLGRLGQRHEVVLVPVDDPADWDIPAMGRVLFTGPGGERMEVDTDSTAGRDAYRRRWDQRRAELGTICRRLGITLIPIATYDEIHHALIEGLRYRARRLVGR